MVVLEEARTHANQDPHTADTTKKLSDATNHLKLDVNIASSEARLTDAVEEAPNLKIQLMSQEVKKWLPILHTDVLVEETAHKLVALKEDALKKILQLRALL